jgi:hypothetical protein
VNWRIGFSATELRTVIGGPKLPSRGRCVRVLPPKARGHRLRLPLSTSWCRPKPKPIWRSLVSAKLRPKPSPFGVPAQVRPKPSPFGSAFAVESLAEAGVRLDSLVVRSLAEAEVRRTRSRRRDRSPSGSFPCQSRSASRSVPPQSRSPAGSASPSEPKPFRFCRPSWPKPLGE